MPSREHERIVDRLVEGGAMRSLFRMRLAYALACREGPGEEFSEDDMRNDNRLRAMLERGRADLVSMDEDEDPKPADPWLKCSMVCRYEEIPERKFPDAFLIDRPARLVTIYEVVKTCDIDPSDYLYLWTILECDEWELRLVVYSHHGMVMGEYGESDFVDLYERALYGEAV